MKYSASLSLYISLFMDIVYIYFAIYVKYIIFA